MIVDDEPDAVEMHTALFSMFGFDVCGTTVALHAIELAVTRRPDVVLCDINMPLVDGVTILRTLKEHALTAHTPVVVLSGDASAAERCELAGIAPVAILDKPCAPSTLVQTLRDALCVKPS